MQVLNIKGSHTYTLKASCNFNIERLSIYNVYVTLELSERTYKHDPAILQRYVLIEIKNQDNSIKLAEQILFNFLPLYTILCGQTLSKETRYCHIVRPFQGRIEHPITRRQSKTVAWLFDFVLYIPS